MKYFRQIIWLVAVIASPAGAMEVQSLQSIREAVQRFAEANVDNSLGETVITVGKLDRRLRLAQCEEPLDVSFPSHVKPLGNITIAVRCHSPKPWSLMVRTRIQQFIDVAVASRPLGRNLHLGTGDIQLSRSDISTLSGGYYASLEELNGMVMRRSVKAGTVLTKAMVKPAILIKRGEKVIINAETGSIHVRMEGKAMQAGARGELIKVKNLSSEQVIEAIVVSPGVVRVRM